MRGSLPALMLAAVAAAAALAGVPTAARAGVPAAPVAGVPTARASGIDGISDQTLAERGRPGDLAGELTAPLFAPGFPPGPPAGIALARYVVQWDALLPSHGAGDYAARFDAWLTDAGALGLQPVVALTSYDGRFPGSAEAYTAGLRAVLARARSLGRPVAFVEPWNEPNGQGHVDSVTAASYANAASAICAVPACTLIAGDFQDRAGAPDYARGYRGALTFVPGAWGVHPYASVAARDLAPLLALRGALPAGAERSLWITEVAALRCRRGIVFGEQRQAQDAAFLVERVVAELDPVHVLYYGLQYPDGRPAPCAPAGGEDGGLFAADGAPRPAAGIVFPALVAATRAASFGPGPA